jgi:hypothetical protein
MPPPAAHRPSLLTLVLIGAGLALVAGAAGVLASPLGDSLWALLGRPANAALTLLPLDTPAYIRLTPTGPQLKHAEALKARFQAVPELKSAWTQAERSLAREQNVSWEADILPWLGPEIVVALPSAKGLGQARGAPELLLVAATRDSARSDAFIKKVRESQERRGDTFSAKQHNGVAYLTDGKDTSIATVNNFVVFATTETLLQRTIDLATGKGGQSLADHPTYQEVIKSLPADRLGDVYIDLLPFVNELGSQRDTGLSARQREALLSMRALALALRLEPDGLAIDTVTLYDPGKMSAEQQALAKQGANPLKVVGALPDETLAFLALRDLRAVWQVAAPARGSFAGGIEAVNRATGLNVDEDVFGWLTGEVGLALIEDTAGFGGNVQLPVGGLLLIEAADRRLVEAKLAKLRAALERQGLRFSAQSIGGVEMHVLTGGRGMPSIGYGFAGDFLVIGTSPNALEQAVQSKTASVAGASAYQGVSAALPKERVAMLYADVARLAPLVSRLGGGSDDEARLALAGLRPVKAIGLASEPMGANNVQRGRLFISIPG